MAYPRRSSVSAQHAAVKGASQTEQWRTGGKVGKAKLIPTELCGATKYRSQRIQTSVFLVWDVEKVEILGTYLLKLSGSRRNETQAPRGQRPVAASAEIQWQNAEQPAAATDYKDA
jgi:hypothetical protein